MPRGPEEHRAGRRRGRPFGLRLASRPKFRCEHFDGRLPGRRRRRSRRALGPGPSVWAGSGRARPACPPDGHDARVVEPESQYVWSIADRALAGLLAVEVEGGDQCRGSPRRRPTMAAAATSGSSMASPRSSASWASFEVWPGSTRPTWPSRGWRRTPAPPRPVATWYVTRLFRSPSHRSVTVSGRPGRRGDAAGGRPRWPDQPGVQGFGDGVDRIGLAMSLDRLGRSRRDPEPRLKPFDEAARAC